jgi:hypothetical protein
MISKNILFLLIIVASITGCSSSNEPDTSNVTNNYTNPTPTTPATSTPGPSGSDNSAYNPPLATETPAVTFSGPAIYRSHANTDYLFSTDPLEGPKIGYFPEEARFGLYAADTAGTIPLYRCLTRQNTLSHFLSIDSKCEGMITEGALGNIYTTKQPNTVTLTRFVNLTTSDHIDIIPGDTVNLNGWKSEGIQGYVAEIKLPTVVQTPNDGKKYFGYYAGAMDGVGTQNYIPELTVYSNLIHIHSSNLEAKLIEVESKGLKAIVSFEWIFLDGSFRLKNDYVQTFALLEPILKKHIGTIAAFYSLDEPYMNGMNKGLKPSEIYYNQETIGRFLKSKFPNTPIGVIFTMADIKANYPLFPSYDWFGFDCYNANMECEGKPVSWFYQQLDERLDAMTFVDRKKRYIISVPQAGHPVKDGSKTGEQNVLVQIPPYRQLVSQYSNKVKVVMPFLWQSFNNGSDEWIGAREMPKVKEQYLYFYADFLKGTL